jgi:hypothetical protein
MNITISRWTLLLTANVLAWGVLSVYQSGWAQNPRPPQLPFANSNEQRSDLVREAREIRELLKETNAILREGLGKNASTKPAR